MALLPAGDAACRGRLPPRAVARLLPPDRRALRRAARAAGARRQDDGQAHPLRRLGHRDAGDVGGAGWGDNSIARITHALMNALTPKWACKHAYIHTYKQISAS